MTESNFIDELAPSDLGLTEPKARWSSSKLISTMIGGIAIAGGASVGSMVAAGEPEELKLQTVELAFDDEDQNSQGQEAREKDSNQQVAIPARASKKIAPVKIAKKSHVVAAPVVELAVQPVLPELNFGNFTNTTQAWSGGTTTGNNTNSTQTTSGGTTTGNTTNSTQTTSGGGGSVSGETDESHTDGESSSSEEHHDH